MHAGERAGVNSTTPRFRLPTIRGREARMKFVDQVKLRVKGGDGGNGAVAFRRETFIPFGGPAGGDGGKGGSVVFVGDEGRNSLLDLVHLPLLTAKRGEHGRGKDQYGKAGADLLVKVPIGTQVYDASSGELITDIAAHDERKVIAQGGQGGRGNIHFASSFDRAPRRAEPGTPGQERALRLELKVIADVGLLGFPNVGKSTLVARMSRARPKIADYPFTTLQPHLGVVRIGGRASTATFVLADIPGLIPGASQGAGLGTRFLKHVERCRALLHLVAPPSDDQRGEAREPLADYDALMAELEAFAPALAEKARRGSMIVAMSKGDIETPEGFEQVRARFAKRGIPLRLVSAATGDGLELLARDLYWMVRGRRPEHDDAEASAPLDARGDAAFEATVATQRAAKSSAKGKAKSGAKAKAKRGAKPAAEASVAAKGKAKSSRSKSRPKSKSASTGKPKGLAKPARKLQTKGKLRPKEKSKATAATESKKRAATRDKRAGGTGKATNTKADAKARARKAAARKAKRAR